MTVKDVKKKLMKQHYQDEPERVLSAELNKDRSHLRLDRNKIQSTVNRLWTEVEDDILRKHYPHLSNVEIAKILVNRTAHVIEQRAARLGLKKDKKFLEVRKKKSLKEHAWNSQAVVSLDARTHGMYSNRFMNEDEKEFYSTFYEKFVIENNITRWDEFMLLDQIIMTLIKIFRCDSYEALYDMTQVVRTEKTQIILENALAKYHSRLQKQLLLMMRELEMTRRTKREKRTGEVDLAQAMSALMKKLTQKDAQNQAIDAECKVVD